jgi:type IV pilus assembly protein PilW
MAHSAALSCGPLRYYYNGKYSSPPGPAGGALAALTFVPIAITNNTGSPDVLTILYTSGNERMLPGEIKVKMAQPQTDFTVDGISGFWANTLSVVSQAGTCALYEITLPVGVGSQLQHAPSLWNPPVGSPTPLPAFDAGALVFNLGSNPTWRSYSINTTANAYQLQVQDVLGALAGVAAFQLVDDLVDLQVEYGKNTDDDPNNIVDAWNATAPVSAAEWQQVVAIRLAVLARSGNYEKPANPGDPCSATTTAPTWAGSGNASSVLTVPGGLPSCYKFRAFETIIPLRNMIWRPA